MVDPLANLTSSEGSLLSVYLDRPSPGGYAALISDLGRVARQSVSSQSKPLQKSVDADLARLRQMADRFESEVAPAYALFASSLDGIWELKALPQPTAPVAVVGARPYLRPLRAVPRPIRTAILVADRSQARLFVGFDGEIDEIEPPITADIGKSNFGGFSGYDEHGVRARAHDIAARLWREASNEMLERHLEKPFDLLLLGGLNQSIEDIRGELHPYLLDLPFESFPASPTEISFPKLKEELALQRVAFRRRREMGLVDELLAASARRERGLLGLPDTLGAVNTHSISDLVVAGDFAKPGVLCPQCGFIARFGDRCSVCSAEMHHVPDVVSAMMDATVSSGGKVHQLMIGSALDSYGIGALTRFEVRAS
jgi:peptide chain release factor subunit 1